MLFNKKILYFVSFMHAFVYNNAMQEKIPENINNYMKENLNRKINNIFSLINKIKENYDYGKNIDEGLDNFCSKNNITKASFNQLIEQNCKNIQAKHLSKIGKYDYYKNLLFHYSLTGSFIKTVEYSINKVDLIVECYICDDTADVKEFITKYLINQNEIKDIFIKLFNTFTIKNLFCEESYSRALKDINIPLNQENSLNIFFQNETLMVKTFLSGFYSQIILFFNKWDSKNNGVTAENNNISSDNKNMYIQAIFDTMKEKTQELYDYTQCTDPKKAKERKLLLDEMNNNKEYYYQYMNDFIDNNILQNIQKQKLKENKLSNFFFSSLIHSYLSLLKYGKK